MNIKVDFARVYRFASWLRIRLQALLSHSMMLHSFLQRHQALQRSREGEQSKTLRLGMRDASQHHILSTRGFPDDTMGFRMVDGEGSAVGRRTVAEWEGSVVFKSALRCDVETLLALQRSREGEQSKTLRLGMREASQHHILMQT
jgi:hypothetical protein